MTNHAPLGRAERRTPSAQPTDGSRAGVLAAARHAHETARTAERDLLVAAIEWAAMHEPSDTSEAAYWWEAGEMIPLAGEGVPEIAEFAVAEFAAVTGRSTDQGRRLIAQALELAWRLPATWHEVKAGRVPAWRGQRIADKTVRLSREAARFVDRHVAGVAGRVGVATLDRLITEAERRAESLTPFAGPDEAGPDARRFCVDNRQVSFEGTVAVYGELDIADAHALDQALAQGAAQLKADGSADSLDARRATALGQLARGDLRFGFGPGENSLSKAPARPVTLFVHLSAASLLDHMKDPNDVGRCGNTHTPISVGQIRTWCGHPDAVVTVKPVIDLNERIHVEAYEIPDRLRQQVELSQLHCVFPYCSRPAERCDLDHITSYADGGPTATDNLAPLCRHHHRLKTHTPWRYHSPEPGRFEWTSPHGHTYLTDRTGTSCTGPPLTT